MDLRLINEVTEFFPFPIPRVEDNLRAFAGAKVFSTLDLTSGFFQIRIPEGDRDYFTFSLPWGRYRFTRLPQGAKNSAQIFQWAMNLVLGDLLYKCVRLYIDDVIVYSDSHEQHVADLAAVLERLSRFNLKARRGKSYFFKGSVDYLGHVIDQDGIKPMWDNVAALRDLKRPHNIRGVRSLLGTVNYYRRFIPNAGRPFILNTDASGIAVGACLQQEIDGVVKPIAYYSKRLIGPETRYSTIEKEAYAVVLSLQHFKHLLAGSKVEVHTDHKPITYNKGSDYKNARLSRWAEIIQDFNVTFVYVPGKENTVADFLSRFPCEDDPEPSRDKRVVAAVIKNRGPPLIDSDRTWEGLLKDKKWAPLLKLIGDRRSTETVTYKNKDYKMHEGYLVSKNSGGIWVKVVPSDIREMVIKYHHDVPTGGHFGVKKEAGQSPVSEDLIAQTAAFYERELTEEVEKIREVVRQTYLNEQEEARIKFENKRLRTFNNGDLILVERMHETKGRHKFEPRPRHPALGFNSIDLCNKELETEGDYPVELSSFENISKTTVVQSCLEGKEINSKVEGIFKKLQDFWAVHTFYGVNSVSWCAVRFIEFHDLVSEKGSRVINISFVFMNSDIDMSPGFAYVDFWAVHTFYGVNRVSWCAVRFIEFHDLVSEKGSRGTKHVHILMSLIQNFNKDHDLPVVAVASVHDTSNLPSSIFSVFLHTITIESFFISGGGQEKVSLRQRISKAIDYISRDLASSDVLHALPCEERFTILHVILAQGPCLPCEEVSPRQPDPCNQLSKVPDENLLNQVELVASNLDQVELVASNFAGLLENQRGVDAASSHLDTKTFSHFKQAANSLGCPKAHYNLGVCYENGHGTSPDLHLAVQHYLMAAREGHASALYNLGMFCLQGLGGLECSETHALTCMQKAACKLLPEALLYMGVYFHERNKSTKAVKYFSQAAQQNNAEAQFYLCLCYHHGWGVAISQSQSRQCFAAASSAGHTDAARWLALHQESRPINISFSASDLKSQDSSNSINPKSPSAYLDVVMSPVFCAAPH
ncbi:K02A2.6-like [Cordylochernes scorpioides]|uniref:K02A2.6-like n=1 Tax=Cordylochernes scorpioides TaxID=51811 RepID=A0ABY6LTK0_9ARAC|nr:K02A2.6-like [Cordylochernes scorpioides]